MLPFDCMTWWQFILGLLLTSQILDIACETMPINCRRVVRCLNVFCIPVSGFSHVDTSVLTTIVWLFGVSNISHTMVVEGMCNLLHMYKY